MPDKNKILHLVPADCEWEPAVRIASLAAALREHGLTSVVTAPDHSRFWEYAEAAGVDIAPLVLHGSLNPLQWIKAARLLKETDAGVIHAHFPESARVLSRAGMFMKDITVVTTRYDLEKPPAAAEYGARVARVICPSQALAEAFAKSGAPDDKIRVVADGVNIAAADRALEERDQLRVLLRDSHCPHKEKPLFIVNVAALDGAGGHAAIIEALAEIVAVLPQTHLIIMGEGPRRGELDRQVRITALEKDVTFIEPDKAFNRLLAAADLYVSASTGDVSGIMVQAAMASGRAVALPPAGCYPELVEDGKTGALATTPDSAGLKEAMLDLLENRTRREHLGRQARAKAAKAFDIAGLAARIAEIYREA